MILQLVANGFDDVIVLEARARIGGRVSVTQLDGKTIHLGAQGPMLKNFFVRNLQTFVPSQSVC